MTDLPPGDGLAIIGAGRVATAVGVLARRAGFDIVGVGYSGRESTARAAARLVAGEFAAGAEPPATAYLLGVPEPAIERLAAGLAGRIAPGAIVVHFAGSAGTAPLRAVEDAGAHACAMHPVQACPDVDTAVARLPGSAWGITCAAPAKEWAERLVRALGGTPVEVAEADRPVWHAASVMTANGISALLTVAEAVLQSIGVSAPIDVLGPLATGAVTNARGGGGGAATLTGPIVRGETGTVAGHLDALSGERCADYRRVARIILAAAHRSGRIDPYAYPVIAALLGSE